MGIRGGPGTQDPGHITVINMPLRFVIQNASDLKDFQLSTPGTVDDVHEKRHADLTLFVASFAVLSGSEMFR
jgi:hypothetical protein